MTMMNDNVASVIRKFARKIIPFLIRLNITPNQVTLGYFFLFVFPTMYLLSFGDYFYNLLAIFLLYVIMFGDHLDGELAKARNMVSKLGARLDDAVGYLTSIFAFIGIGVSLKSIYPSWLIIVSCLIISVYLFRIQKSKLNFFLRSYLFWLTVCVPFNLLSIPFFFFAGVGCLRMVKLLADSLWRLRI